ncbi:MAG TPA: MOSC N-terminal beta barrel domain-containing protein [Polyangiales bacterium]|nr:MOSC N-terminal beta barrel domain-containing protein [Polyangiales bacterium]
MSEHVGHVAAIHRYPVKSMRGEQLAEAFADERGLLGDRAYAVVDVETGTVASAKHPRRWGALLACSARFEREPARDEAVPPVHISLPDGSAVTSDDARVHEALSALLGRAVRLESQAPKAATFDEHWPDIEGLSPEGHRDTFTSEPLARLAPPGTFFDMTAFHVMSRRSLAALAEAVPESRVATARFRPNFEIEGEGAPAFVENDWTGKLLRLGDALALKVLLPTMRCVMVTLAQEDLPSDPQILRALVSANRVQVADVGKYPCIGAYASLARKVSPGGLVRRGDACAIG